MQTCSKSSPIYLLRDLGADEGPFCRVGSNFAVASAGGDAGWIGPVIASPHAVYLVKERAEFNGAAPATPEMLLAATFDDMELADDDVRTCFVDELPPTVRQRIDRRGRRGRLSAIVVPRASVSRVKFGNAWSSMQPPMRLHQGEDDVVCVLVLFIRNGKVRRFLRHHGWPVDQQVTPSMPPVHGPGFGRSVPKKPRAPKSMAWLRWFYATLILLIIGIIVASKMTEKPKREYDGGAGDTVKRSSKAAPPARERRSPATTQRE